MTRDYAKRGAYKSRRSPKKTFYLGLWLFVLLIFILFTIGLVYFGKLRQTKELSQLVKVETTKQTEQIKKIEKNIVPKVDFYTMLPPKKSEKSAIGYELEIATVKEYAVADRLKAELALIGFIASITPMRKNSTQMYEVAWVLMIPKMRLWQI